MPAKRGCHEAEIRRLLRETNLSLREVARRLEVTRSLVNAIAKREFADRQTKPTPTYRLHRPSGLAFVEIDGKREYLGPYATPESRQRYHSRLAELAAKESVRSTHNEGNFQDAPAPTAAASGDKLIVDQLLWRFWSWAKLRYRDESGPTAHLANLRQTMKKVTKQFGNVAVADFGPSHIRALREQLIQDGAARSYINKLVGYVKQIFAWGMEEEIVPELVAFRVIKTRNLRAGRSAARETAPVEPVADIWVDATLPYLPAPVRAMVELQRLTGMRSSNVCEMRASEIDTAGDVWIYVPRRHKTMHLGHRLRIPLGPRSQAIIRPFLGTRLDAYLFSPREAAEASIAAKSAARKSKRYGKQLARTRKPAPQRAPGECYDARTYCRAIARAIEMANMATRRKKYEELAQKTGGGRWLHCSPEMAQELAGRLIPHWHPHQLRHARSTAVRQQYGLEGAQVALSHRDRRTTERYAKLDDAEALRIARETG